MNWSTDLAAAGKNLDSLRKLQPDTGAGFTALHHAALGEGAISVKNKELMALAIGISKQCVDCIGFHIRAAIAAGVTREEIAETISVCVLMGGGPSFMYGAKALEAYDQLSQR